MEEFKQGERPRSFIDYPEIDRFRLEASIRQKRSKGESFNSEEQAFIDASHDFFDSEDQDRHGH